MIPLSDKAATRKGLKDKLDAIARTRCFMRDSVAAGRAVPCQRCGNNNVEWAHVISRRDLSLRWELDNNLSLCHSCHVWFDAHRKEARAWFASRWPERWEHIQKIWWQRDKMFGSSVEHLKELLAQMKGLR
jgi:hypothetical protein